MTTMPEAPDTVAPNERTPDPAPKVEVGYAAQSVSDWYGSLTEERVPELRWPAAYDVYDEMMDDPQVSSVMSAVVMPILRTGWRLDGTGCRPDIVQHCADDLAIPIVGEGNKLSDTTADERFSWNEHLAVALPEMCSYGHSFYEQKAYQDVEGLWHLQKLGWRPPRTITKINTAADAGLISLEQQPNTHLFTSPTDRGPRKLGVRRVVVYVHGRKGSNWRGRSLLKAAYKPWLMNNRGERIEMIVAERQGAPLVVYTDSQEGDAVSLERGRRIAMSVRAGREAGVSLPYGATLKQQGVEGQLPDLDKTIQRNNQAIARAVLAHFLTLGNQTGSWALGSSFQDFFTLAIQSIGDEVARIGSRHVVRDIVDWNWPGERAPRLVFDEIGSRQDSIVSAIATLVGAGVLKADEDLEQFTRTALGLPPRDTTRTPPRPQEES